MFSYFCELAQGAPHPQATSPILHTCLFTFMPLFIPIPRASPTPASIPRCPLEPCVNFSSDKCAWNTSVFQALLSETDES